jgi:hypothetical protein
VAGRRRIYHNAIVALLEAKDLGIALPERIFEHDVRPGADRADLDADDLAAAYAAYGRSTAALLDGRLARLRGARATPEAIVELVEVAALMLEARHPHAAEAQELLQRAVERPLGIDERIGARPASRPYDDAAVRDLVARLDRPLKTSNRARLYCDTIASLLAEQGELELAQLFAARSIVRK